MDEFFNFHRFEAEGWWGRRAFLGRWWRVNRRDRRWTPQNYSVIYRAIVRGSEEAVARFSPSLITLEALMRNSQSSGYPGSILSGPSNEQCVGLVAPLLDDRGEEPVVWLTLFNSANDSDVMERLLGIASEAHSGVRLIGPASLTPRLSSGVLLDHFHIVPPLNSPYNPPYVAELLEGVLEPYAYDRMWLLDVGAHSKLKGGASEARIERIDAGTLCVDLLPLLHSSWEPLAGEPPDASEVEFALRLWQGPPLLLWCAYVGESAVGYLLAQADEGRFMRRTDGGRTVRGRAWQLLRGSGHASAGRVLLHGVAPEQRGQGAANALIAEALRHAEEAGWNTLSIGPIPEGAAAEELLSAWGARPRQRYARFTSQLED
jgi:ribosomal protein S18 acetylase RimI-like enzyme